MNRFFLTAAFVLTAAAPALASDQFANSLNLDAGSYSTAELVALRSAMENDNQAAANFILNGGADRTASDIGSAQLAASVGVEPGVYTTAELVALKSAMDSDDQSAVRFIKANPGGSDTSFVVSSKGSEISGGRAQLAASLGVDASDYSVAQLTRLKATQSSDNGRHD